LGDYLTIEEGLGTINKYIETAMGNGEPPYLYDAALNYIAAIIASHKSF
jgi:hypothetical protein